MWSSATPRAEPGSTLTVLIGLLLVGLCFHVVAFVLNDIFDLELDRTDPTRVQSPLVAGQISPFEQASSSLPHAH